MSLWTQEFSLINDSIIYILKLYLSNKVYLLHMLLKIIIDFTQHYND